MALYTTIATGNWHADAATVWDLGSEPGAADTFLLNHDVTKDDDKSGTADAASGTISTGKTLTLGAAGTFKSPGTVTVNGTLAIGGRPVDIGKFAGSAGLITGGPGGSLITHGWDGYGGTGNHPKWQIEGSSGAPFAYNGSGAYTGSTYAQGGNYFKHATITGSDHVAFANDMIYENCSFSGSKEWIYSGPPGIWVFRNCAFSSHPIHDGNSAHLTILCFNCTGVVCSSMNGVQEVFLFNCTEGTHVFAGGQNFEIHAQGAGQVPGAWAIRRLGGDVIRSTASKKSGDYGNELTPRSACTSLIPCFVDYFIPVATGDTVAPSIEVTNVTADLGLAGAAGRMTFELDPGDEWGLNETIDASSLADPYNNWRQVQFTGGTAGGSGDKGTVLLRVTLARYVATGVVYLADLDPGVA